jgi:hypothetical protein
MIKDRLINGFKNQSNKQNPSYCKFNVCIFLIEYYFNMFFL